MEVNRDHPLVRNLLKIYKKNVQDDHLKLVTEQLYESALLMDGYLEDAHEMINRIEGLMERSTEWYLSSLN
jgi:molecular chaperone HtpG